MTERYVTMRAANIARQKHWDPESKITSAFRALELAGELGELCNVLKKLEREKLGLRGSRATRQQLEEEFADVYTCLDLLAMDYDIDLLQVAARKFNAVSIKHDLPVFMELL